MLNQRTLAQKISVTGIGLHSGKKVTLTLYPAPVDFGIQFKRIDLPNPKQSGLTDAIKILKDIEQSAFCNFDAQDVVRHQLVKNIVRAYDNA